jgi:uncharacterized protein
MKFLRTCLAPVAAWVLLACAPTAQGSETSEDEAGILNPQELMIDYYARKADAAVFDPKMCLYGYPAAKMGDHAAARRIFERCSREGVMGAMPWMSWTEENGYDRPASPEKAADWDRRAAEAGYSIGQFNYGLDLLRGHGVKRDEILGRAYVDRAARQGDSSAAELAAQGYDPEAVTPDADKERYRQPMY